MFYNRERGAVPTGGVICMESRRRPFTKPCHDSDFLWYRFNPCGTCFVRPGPDTLLYRKCVPIIQKVGSRVAKALVINAITVGGGVNAWAAGAKHEI